jgi:uncharacterized protein with PIN domain
MGRVREMSVLCAGCGREYDVTLFEFGRTLWCTCGNRVGVETRVRRIGADAETRFIADAMLGKLAHWLRLLGFDCAYESEIDDGELVRRGIEQDRIVLTRDRALPDEWRASGICVVRAERTFEQLEELMRRFDLARAVRPFTRCSACNERLSEADAADLTGRAPASILATRERLRECPGCKRVYWKGSHARRIQRVVDRLLAAG